MKNEFSRNLTGYILLALGIACVAAGELRHLDLTAKTGGGLITAALLAFQSRRSGESANPTPPAQ